MFVIFVSLQIVVLFGQAFLYLCQYIDIQRSSQALSYMCMLGKNSYTNGLQTACTNGFCGNVSLLIAQYLPYAKNRNLRLLK